MNTVRTIIGAAICVVVQIGLTYSIELALAWIIVSIFYYHENETLVFAFSAGLLHDIISTPFGYHLILYTALALIGSILVKVAITHRSPIAFCALGVLLSILFFGFSFLLTNVYEIIHTGDFFTLSVRQWMRFMMIHSISISMISFLFYGSFNRFLSMRRY